MLVGRLLPHLLFVSFVMSGFLFRDAVQSDFQAILMLNEASVHFLSPLDLAKLTRLSKEPVFFPAAMSGTAVAGFLLAFLPAANYDTPISCGSRPVTKISSMSTGLLFPPSSEGVVWRRAFTQNSKDTLCVAGYLELCAR
jgi:hypothetical protein